MKVRGFEKISKEQFLKDTCQHNISTEDDIKQEQFYDSIQLPTRSTSRSAAYDLRSVGTFTIKPNEVVKIPTGLKVYMPDNEAFFIFIRSGMSLKHRVTIANNVGIIDADYFNNPNNEGHFWVVLKNEGDLDINISNGDRIAQGIFIEYKTIDNDTAEGTRGGGFGSTGK